MLIRKARPARSPWPWPARGPVNGGWAVHESQRLICWTLLWNTPRLERLTAVYKPHDIFHSTNGNTPPRICSAMAVGSLPRTPCRSVCGCAAARLHDYREALWSTVQVEGDIDTNCAIVGGIVALAVGREGLPDALRCGRANRCCCRASHRSPISPPRLVGQNLHKHGPTTSVDMAHSP